MFGQPESVGGLAILIFDCIVTITFEHRGPRQHSAQGAVLQIGRSLVRSQMVSSKFFTDIKSFRSHYGRGVNSAPNRNEYQEYFLGVKPYHHPGSLSRNLGTWNPLGTSGQ